MALIYGLTVTIECTSAGSLPMILRFGIKTSKVKAFRRSWDGIN